MGDFKVLKKKDRTLVEYSLFVPMTSLVNNTAPDWSSVFVDACEREGYVGLTDVVVECQYNFVKEGYDTVIRAWVERADGEDK